MINNKPKESKSPITTSNSGNKNNLIISSQIKELEVSPPIETNTLHQESLTVSALLEERGGGLVADNEDKNNNDDQHQCSSLNRSSIERQAAFLRQESDHQSPRRQQSASTTLCHEEKVHDSFRRRRVSSRSMSDTRQEVRFACLKRISQQANHSKQQVHLVQERRNNNQSMTSSTASSVSFGDGGDDEAVEEEEEEAFYPPSFAWEDLQPMAPLPMLFPYHVSSGIGLMGYYDSSITTGLSHSKLGRRGSSSTRRSIHNTSVSRFTAAASDRRSMSPARSFSATSSLKTLRSSRSCENIRWG